MNNIDRRYFLTLGGGATLIALLPLTGCGGGSDSNTAVSYPPVSDTNKTPTAATTDGVQFSTAGKTHTLVIRQRDGTQRSYGGVGSDSGKFNYPAGVAVLDGLAYVVETGNHRVQVFDGKGNVVRTFGEDVLLYPGGIAAGTNEIFVADTRHARIVVFATDGTFKRVLGADVLSAPRGLEVVKGGLLVADPGLRKVVMLSFDDQLKGEYGTNWVLPYDVTTDGSLLYIADASRNELGVTTLSGEQLASIPLDVAPANVWFTKGTLYYTPVA